MEAVVIRVLGYRPHQRGTLRAWCDLALTNTGIVLIDCGWHVRDGQEWVSLLAQSYVGPDGVRRWQALVVFIEGATRERQRFQAQALEAIHAAAAQEEAAR
jgi:hypothetical protein